MLEHLYSVNKDIYIDMRNEIFTGDVLDIGLENYGIIYNLYKLQNREGKLDYLQGEEEKELIDKGSYDSCILLFALSSIWLKENKKKLFKDISNFLREDGVLHIWDIDKSFTKLFRGRIKILLPETSTKEINITDLNILKDASKESAMRLLKQYFEIIDLKDYDNVYYIKAKKRMKSTLQYRAMHSELKGSTEHESNISSSKFKIRSQQLGSKIFEGFHKRFKL